MKQTKFLGLIVGLVLGLAVVKEDIGAITNFRLMPTSTPTPIIIKKIINPNLIKIISTDTPAPTAEITPTVAEVTVTPAISPIVTPLDTDQPAAVNQSSKDMTFWFLIVTIGLLAVIIIVQAWPKKNEEE